MSEPQQAPAPDQMTDQEELDMAMRFHNHVEQFLLENKCSVLFATKALMSELEAITYVASLNFKTFNVD